MGYMKQNKADVLVRFSAGDVVTKAKRSISWQVPRGIHSDSVIPVQQSAHDDRPYGRGPVDPLQHAQDYFSLMDPSSWLQSVCISQTNRA
jgi:hypothetical protein